MQWNFSPLFNSDGTTCRFRVSCLALAATCALLHVFLKAGATPEVTTETGDIQISAAETVESANLNEVKEVALTTSAPKESSVWSFFGSDEDNEQLLKIRKQALNEINDGAAYLAACGNINAGYVGCKYQFSDNINPYYKANIEAAADGFMITLEAKGEQLKDDCSKFVVNSEGYYAGFNKQGHMDQKCLLDTAPSTGVLALQKNVDKVQGNPAPSGAMLAAGAAK